MEDLLDRVKVSVGDVVKFIVVIVIPLTAWFYIIKFELELNAGAIADVQKQTEKIETRQDILNTKILNKLEAISEDVAEIKGRLNERK